MSAFKFNSAAVAPQAEVRVDVPESSDAARIIAVARARGIERFRENNAPGADYGFGYPASYYVDREGPETSAYDFNHVLYVLYVLRDPRFGTEWSNHVAGAGIVTPIADLKTALARRIAELGISEVLMGEYLAVPHSTAEYLKFHALSFEERINRFRKVEK